MLQMDCELVMTRKTRFLLWINDLFYSSYRWVNDWTFDHMDKKLLNANHDTKGAKE